MATINRSLEENIGTVSIRLMAEDPRDTATAASKIKVEGPLGIQNAWRK